MKGRQPRDIDFPKSMIMDIYGIFSQKPAYFATSLVFPQCLKTFIFPNLTHSYGKSSINLINKYSWT
jgi:hypothetical protein